MVEGKQENEVRNLVNSAWCQRAVGGAADVKATRLIGNPWLTESVWRLDGPLGAAVAKTTRPEPGPPTPDSGTWPAHWTKGSQDALRWNYPRREFLAYTSGMSEVYAPYGIDSPRLIHAEQSDDSLTLVLEAVDYPATEWVATDYAEAARRLGLAQGSLLGSRWHSRSPEWLAIGYLPDYATDKPIDRSLTDRDDCWEQAYHCGVPSRLRSSLSAFAGSEAPMLTALREAPQGLCHNDFWTRNLFGAPRSNGRISLIDWAFVGPNAMGADIANMVASAAFDGFVDAVELDAFGELAYGSYLGGLREGGWRGPEAAVRRGYVASFAKYSWVVPALLRSATEERHPIYVGYGDGESLDFARVAHALEVIAGWADIEGFGSGASR